MLLFFDAHLKDAGEAAQGLTVEDLRPLLRGAVTEVEVLSK
jgi:hypothetical protein